MPAAGRDQETRPGAGGAAEGQPGRAGGRSGGAGGGGGLRRVLVANRGEIACRIIRTLHELGLEAVAVHSDADRGAAHVTQADHAVRLGPAPAAESYLRIDRLLAAARRTGSDALHPGYGFLSESAQLAAAVEASGLAFVGPTPEQLRDFGDKHVARRIAGDAGVPLLPGSDLLPDLDAARAAATTIGYPVMLKASAGGGGIGLRACADDAELVAAFDEVSRLGAANFGSGAVFLERLVPRARHVEVQVFGDGRGDVAVLGERDCSMQRRHQKVIEEAPAPGLPATTRQALQEAARSLATAVRYRSAGTVEFVVDADTGQPYFLEVNTRLQVEHGVTELLYGIDLVAWMVRLAGGDRSMLDGTTAAGAGGGIAGGGIAGGAGGGGPDRRGHAIEARVYAENPVRGFQPSAGRLTRVQLPVGVRCDGWVRAGTEVTPFYDPLLVKLIAHGPTRAEAIARLDAALGDLRLDGVETNAEHLRALLADEAFAAGRVTTSLVAEVPFRPDAVEVVDDGGNDGGQTIVVSHPGRTGYWSVGVPPSGPMDDLSFRLGNQVLGNPGDAAGLECTTAGPVLRFHRPATVCLTGADMAATLTVGREGERAVGEAGRQQIDHGDDVEPSAGGWAVPPWAVVDVPAGAILRLSRVVGPGARGYVCVQGGIDVPQVLGSRTTFVLGGFGGHAGRPLVTGDLLRVGPALEPPREGPSVGDRVETVPEPATPLGSTGGARSDSGMRVGGSPGSTATATWSADGPGAPTTVGRAAVPEEVRPRLTNRWELAVMDGPQGAPDHLTDDDVELFYGSDWEVHYNSARTGVRLVGPRFTWARPDGGDAGLHPSNIHDNAYAVGTVDFTGDMPVILGPDGPSLGGFVCPATVVDADLWKLGQLRAGDVVRFVPVGPESAAPPAAVGSAWSAAAAGEVGAAGGADADSGAAAPADGGAGAAAGAGSPTTSSGRRRTVLAETEDLPGRPGLTFRRSGDRHLLVEVGPPVLDLDLRVRVHQLAGWLGEERTDGLHDITPGIRSLQLQVDGDRLTVERAIELVRRADAELPPIDQAVLASRIVHLPLSWDDPAVRKAIEIYMRSVRPDAPWCPSNLEFIRRINGLDSVDDVRAVVFGADYVVYGLGDVYLGAPVATPLDPRHRLVTTKYNPARTWTPENAVGIGGAYLCIYGMEGPGGYQFVGRSTPVWQRWPAEGERPWLLDFFDRIRFFPVDADELLELRADAAAGRWRPEIEPGTLAIAEHHRFLASIAPEADAARERQRRAFDAERAAWAARGELADADGTRAAGTVPEGGGRPGAGHAIGGSGPLVVPDGAHVVTAPLTARVLSVAVGDGDRVAADETLIVLEAMKTETTIRTPAAGTVAEVRCRPDDVVTAGQPLAVVTPRPSPR